MKALVYHGPKNVSVDPVPDAKLGAAASILLRPKSGGESRDLLRSKSAQGAMYAKQNASDGTDLAKQKVDELDKLLRKLSIQQSAIRKRQ